MANHLETFLTELKANTNVNKIVPIGATMWDKFIADANKLDDQRAEQLTLTDGAYNWFSVAGGKVEHPDGSGILVQETNPQAIRIINGEIWVASYSDEIKIYDTNFSFLRQFHFYGDFSTTDGYQNVADIAHDPVNNHLAVCSYNMEMIRIYDLDNDNAIIGNIGTYDTIGDAATGNLYNSWGCCFFKGGTRLLVANANGIGQGSASANSYGHVSEYQLDGTFVKTHLRYDYSGYCENGEVYNPYRVRVDEANNEAFVLNRGRNQVGVFDITDPDNWEFKDSFTVHTDMMVDAEGNPLVESGDTITDALGLYGFDFSATHIYLAASGQNWIYRVNRANHDVEGYLKSDFLTDNANPLQLGTILDIRDVCLFGSSLLAADYAGVMYGVPAGLFDDVHADPDGVLIQYATSTDPNNGQFVPLTPDSSGKVKFRFSDIIKRDVPSSLYRIYNQ